MSTERVEIKPEDTNVSLEEQAKQQTATATENSETSVSVNTEDNTARSTDDTRPEWLPEKFANAEELAKAYGELEKKFSSNKSEEPSIIEARRQAEANEQAENTLEPFYSEYAEKGTLSEKSYADLAKMGLDKNLVDGYIAGQKAIADNEIKQIHDIVGGADKYSELLNWSQENLTDAEKTAFNSMLDTGTVEQVKLAVQAVANRAGISGDVKNKMIEGDTISSSIDVYESVAQVTKDMNDPRYDKDPAFRSKVEQKLARSSVV